MIVLKIIGGPYLVAVHLCNMFCKMTSRRRFTGETLLARQGISPMYSFRLLLEFEL